MKSHERSHQGAAFEWDTGIRHPLARQVILDQEFMSAAWVIKVRAENDGLCQIC
jgi:hypothetical protein